MSERTSAVFFTGSSVVWGAELSLLTIAAHTPSQCRLVASNPDLIDAWARSVGDSGRRVRARGGRVSRLFGFVPAAVAAIWRRETVVVFDFYLLPLFALLRPLAVVRGARIVVDVHDAVAANPRRRPYFMLMRFTDLAVCVSEYIANQVQGARKTVVYRPVEVPARSDEPATSGVVGVVGQIAPDKSTDLAIRAAAAAGARVVVRGAATEDNQRYLEQVLAVGEQELGTRFAYEGRVPRERVMDGIDVLAVTNADEPFGRVAAEAQLAGVVVVGPSSGGIAEIVEDGVTGYTYPAGDFAALSRKLEQAIQAPQTLRDHARDFAVSAFDPVSQSLLYMRTVLGAPHVDA